MNVLVVMSSMGPITVILSFIFIFIRVLLSRWSVDSSSSFCVKTWIKPGCLSPTHSCTDYSKRDTIEWSVVFVLLFYHELSYFHVFLLGYLQVIHVMWHSSALHKQSGLPYKGCMALWLNLTFPIHHEASNRKARRSVHKLIWYFHIQVLFSPLVVVIYFLYNWGFT